MRYPPGMLEKLRARGARMQQEARPSSPWDAGEAPQQNGFWRAGLDDEATSIFKPSEGDDSARAARRADAAPTPAPGPAGKKVEVNLRNIPDHGPTGVFPLASQLPEIGGFEEEPTALFMADGEVDRVALRDIPDHGRTGLVYPIGKVVPPPAPSPAGGAGPIGVARPSPAPAAVPPVGVATPGSLDAPVRRPAAPAAPAAPTPPRAPPIMNKPVASPAARPTLVPFGGEASGVFPIPTGRPTPNVAAAPAVTPAPAPPPAPTSPSIPPESPAASKGGATLEEIMRLKVQAPPPQPAWRRAMPQVLIGLLVLLLVVGVLVVLGLLWMVANG